MELGSVPLTAARQTTPARDADRPKRGVIAQKHGPSLGLAFPLLPQVLAFWTSFAAEMAMKGGASRPDSSTGGGTH